MHACTHLVVEGADVQGGVPRGVLGPHVGPVEQQVLQVLHVSKAAGLGEGQGCWVPGQAQPLPLTQAGLPTS